MWKTTISLEFRSESQQHLKTLGNELKSIRGVDVSMVEPVDPQAPVLIAIGIDNNAKLPVETVAQNVATTLYDFLHTGPASSGQHSISLVTSEGERVAITQLSADEITRLLVTARENETAE